MAYTVSCLLCGRQLARVVNGRLDIAAGQPMLRRAGRALRCGYCRGNAVVEPDISAPTPRAGDELGQIARGA